MRETFSFKLSRNTVALRVEKRNVTNVVTCTLKRNKSSLASYANM